MTGKLKYDYSKLKGKIKEKFGTQEDFAKALSISNTSLSYKITSKRQWTQNEIKKACELLGIEGREIRAYFFTLKV
jgi:hypothetical protein